MLGRLVAARRSRHGETPVMRATPVIDGRSLDAPTWSRAG
jgi:hypothetical protein